MSSVVISGDTSGAITLAAPAVAGTNTINLPAAAGTVMVSGNMPAFSAYMSTNPVCSHNTNTKMPFNTEEFDTNNCFDSSTNYRFTPTVAGYYTINCSLRLGGTSGRQYDHVLSIYKNGSAITQNTEYSFAMGTGQQTTFTINSLISMNGTTDYIEIYFYPYDYTASSTVTVYGSTSRFQAVLSRNS